MIKPFNNDFMPKNDLEWDVCKTREQLSLPEGVPQLYTQKKSLSQSRN